MTRRPRRTLPATLVALVVLAACVLVAVSSIQVLAGRRPLVPLAALARYGEHLHWNATAVIAVGAAAAGAGLVLLTAGLWPGKPTVLPLAPTDPPGDSELAGVGEALGGEAADGGEPCVTWCPADAGVTRRGLSAALRTTLADTAEVSKPTVRIRRRRISGKAQTESHDTTTVHGRAAAELDRAVATVRLHHPPRLRLHVSRARRSA